MFSFAKSSHCFAKSSIFLLSLVISAKRQTVFIKRAYRTRKFSPFCVFSLYDFQLSDWGMRRGYLGYVSIFIRHTEAADSTRREYKTNERQKLQ